MTTTMAATTTTTTTKNSIRILICSSNMGNAKPDEKSLDALIPLDGLCRKVIPPKGVKPEFPLIMDPRRAKNPPLPESNEEEEQQQQDYHQKQQKFSIKECQEFEIMFQREQQQQDITKAINNNVINKSETPTATSTTASSTTTSSFDPFDLETAFPATPFGDFENEATATTSSATATAPPPSQIDLISSNSSGGDEEEDESQFDIIVIGMQEATFNMGEEEGKNKDYDDDDDDSLSSSGDDEDDDDAVLDSDAAGDYSALDSSDDDDVDVTCEKQASGVTTAPKKKSKVKKLGGALSKIGKKASTTTMKLVKESVKVTNKVGKVTVKNTVKAKALVTAQDNTDKNVPSPQEISNLEEEMMAWSDTRVLHYMIEEQLPSYKRFLSYQLGEMRLLIYVQDKQKQKQQQQQQQQQQQPLNLDLLSVKTQATGKHGLANKGGIVAEVAVNETTRLGFLSAHLEAHEGEEHYAARCSSFYEILRGTRSVHTPFKYDATSASHFTFVLGDLNFRTKLFPGYAYGSERHIDMCHNLAVTKNWRVLNKFDELAKALREKKCLLGFATPYCNFDPTFKVARKGGYEYNPKRSPSYTDRILFKTTEQLQPSLRPLIYEPCRDFVSSDHKPIRGAFVIKLNESLFLGNAPESATQQSNGPGATSSPPRNNKQGRLHLLVSSMRCQLDRELYDTLRGTDNAMPNPYIAFVSTPPEALQTNTTKQSSSGKKKGSSSSAKTNFPATSVISEAFKPNWKDELLYFRLQTHYSDGYPIDLAGALMHVSVFEKRYNDTKLLGAVTLNLSKLIENAKYSPRQLQPQQGRPQGLQQNTSGSMRWTRNSPTGSGQVSPGRGLKQPPPPARGGARGRGGRAGPQGRSGRGLQGQGTSGRGMQKQNSGRGGMQKQNSGRGGITPPPFCQQSSGGKPQPQIARSKSCEGSLLVQRPLDSGGGSFSLRGPPLSPAGRMPATVGRGRGGRGPAQARGNTSSPPGRPATARVASTRAGMGAWAAGKPSKALESAFKAEGMPFAVTKASKALMRKKMAAKEGKSLPPGKNIKVVSLHLSEAPLLDGSNEVGRITLSIDAWWMGDDELKQPKETST